MSWKKTSLILGVMALTGTAVELYKRQYVLNQTVNSPQTVKIVEEVQPVVVTLPSIRSLPDAYNDKDYQVLARVVLSETDALYAVV